MTYIYFSSHGHEFDRNKVGRESLDTFKTGYFSSLPRYGGLLSSPPGGGSYSPGPIFNVTSCAESMTTPASIGVGQKRPASSSGGGSRSKKVCDPDSKGHIKKPLNAFMLYMKEMRPKIVAECTLKESAAINQILGRRVRNNLA
jgi:hypothetical protein